MAAAILSSSKTNAPSGVKASVVDDTEIKLNPQMVQKIQNYMNDSVYRESIKNASSYNSRLSLERTQRLPFLDSQTGVAQNHSNLWMDARQRLPGLREGQLYSYPSKRWKKKRRQYLSNFMQPRFTPGVTRKEPVPEDLEPPVIASEASTPTPGPSTAVMSMNEDSRDSSSMKEETKPQEWFYDELDMGDVGDFEEPDPDSDYDYEESYSKRKKKKLDVVKPRRGVPSQTIRQGASPSNGNSNHCFLNFQQGTGSRGRRKITYDALTDPDKPFACDICGARYKTRPGLTYHYTHSHKEKEDDDMSMIDDEGSMGHGSPKSRDDNSVETYKEKEGRRRVGSSLAPPLLHPQQPPYLQPQQTSPSSSMPGLLMHMTSGVGGSSQMQHHNTPPPPHNMSSPTPPHLVPQQQPPPHQQQSHSQHQQQQQQQQQVGPHPLSQVPMSQRGSNSMGSNNSSGSPSYQNQSQPPQGNGSTTSSSGGQSTFDENRKNEPPRVQPSPYCDFCLGDAAENKKTGTPEELVSCSDCGRSGHPSCLQFTTNMTISVKKYRWQCIECKCCSICGTSDNDDQLLFCDDCDRGYHMYCLMPPLDAPPEGSWSCTLCIAEFHQNK